MTTDFLTNHLATVARMLSVLSTSDLERHVRECGESLARADSLGPILDPTAWMRAKDGGSLDDARHQLDIARHLLAARKAIDTRETALEQRIAEASR